MMWLSFHVAFSLTTSASAFGSSHKASSAAQNIAGRTPFLTRSATAPESSQQLLEQHARKKSSLSAVIYGWDGEEETASAADESVAYGLQSRCAGAAATPAAAALAESLSYDGDRVGSLARLAVAFSPPERALSLKDIEKVEVLCVDEDRIEIEAVVCGDGGCVTLAVPVSFPQACGSEWLEGCVMRNLDELDAEADSLIRVMDAKAASNDDPDLDELCELNKLDGYPSWWVPPECDAALVAECDTVRRLLNEEEFQDNVNALAQTNLGMQENGEGYDVKRAVVAAVGPAGICLKVRAAYRYEADMPIHTLDVLVPFGGEPKQDADSLRAAVLGAVMAA